jgi:hypothetical protein
MSMLTFIEADRTLFAANPNTRREGVRLRDFFN